MPLAFKPDYERAKTYYDAFWKHDLLDRPLTLITVTKPPAEQVAYPLSRHAVPAERWMDAQYQADWALAHHSNYLYLGDALPISFPNLGPEVFSAFYGCPLHFGDYGTSWTEPALEDWSQADALKMDWNSPYLKKLVEITEAMLAVGRGKFITGMTDWHPGGDALAAFRDPANFAIDMKTNLADVKKLLQRVEADYFAVYDYFYKMLRAADQPITSWMPLISEGKYYIPSNDFSIMISKQMYDEVFLPGIINECRFLDHSIYHLDGPGALRHLDSILAIPELNALQWVPGAGNEGFTRWIDVYRKAQAAGKGIQISCSVDELPEIMNTLHPRGLFLMVGGVGHPDEAENILKELVRWTKGKY